MTLMTARPWKHPKTGTYYLRQRTPLDLLHSVKGQSVALPVGDAFITVKVGDAIQASLLTKDIAEARSRHSVADGALKRFWEAQRKGPARLNQRQITALGGLAEAGTRARSREPVKATRGGMGWVPFGRR